jgi:hypothetical protein
MHKQGLIIVSGHKDNEVIVEYYRNQIEEIAKKLCAEMHLALYDFDEKMSERVVSS